MKILITGGAGFIGSHACERFLSSGYDVVALDNFSDSYSPKRKRRNVADLLAHPRFKLVECDCGDRLGVSDVLKAENVEVVLHLAAFPGRRLSVYDPQKYERINVSSLVSMLEALRDYGPRRIVAVSADAVYGGETPLPFREDAPCLHPESPYGATKRAAEIFLHTYHQLYDFDVLLLRTFTVYGPRQRPEMAVSAFSRSVLTGESIPFYGDGSTARDYTYVSDIVDGLQAAVEKFPVRFGIYNLGAQKELSLSQLLQNIEQLLGKKATLEHQPLQPGDVARTCADISRARQELGYEPKVTFQDGLQKSVEWVQQELRRV